MKLKYTYTKQVVFSKRLTNTSSLYICIILSFSSQWERLQCDNREPGQLKGITYNNSIGACNVKYVLFSLTWSLLSENV